MNKQFLFAQIKIPILEEKRDKLIEKYNLPKSNKFFNVKEGTVFELIMYKGKVSYIVRLNYIKELQSKEITDKIFTFYKMDYKYFTQCKNILGKGTLITRAEAFKLLGVDDNDN